MNKKLHSSYPVLKSEDSSYKQEINFLGQHRKIFEIINEWVIKHKLKP